MEQKEALEDTFPWYKLIVGNDERWEPLPEAIRLHNSTNGIPARMAGKALESSGLVRNITEDERQQILNKAKQHSDSSLAQ